VYAWNCCSLDAVAHWAALIDAQGWVAREQILGSEATAAVRMTTAG